MITPVIINRLQWKAYLIFMCTNYAFIPLVYFCYPETANLTLEEIDLLYTQPGQHARHVAERLQKERRLQLARGDATDSDRDEKDGQVQQDEHSSNEKVASA